MRAPSDRMSPRSFVVGTAVTVVLSIAFYTWLLRSVVGLSTSWLIAIMGPTAVFVSLGSIYGYYVWLSNRGLPHPSMRLDIFLASFAFFLIVAAPAWLAVYLVSRDFRTVGSAVAIAAAAAAVFGLRWFVTWQRRLQPTASSLGRTVPDPFQVFRAAVIGVGVSVPVAVAVALVLRGDVAAATLTAVVAACLLPWAIRKIRKELQTPFRPR